MPFAPIISYFFTEALKAGKAVAELSKIKIGKADAFFF
jgi:hypothetical protein